MMLNSPFEFTSSLHIGTVIFVSPDEIKVQLEIDAPDSVALNTGTPRAFPRINSYLLVPSDTGFLVGQVQWITIENSQYPKRKGLQDFGLIDLPFPLRKLSLSPLGMLYKNDNEEFEFRRGIDAFPSVGDAVLFPTDMQMRAIVTSGSNLRVKIGTSPLAGNADVKIDPDRLFGRHVAVLGNTGSGKSCSVAGLIRWSLEAARANNYLKKNSNQNCNARFIILDPNSEYVHAFQKELNTKNSPVHRFSVIPQDNSQQLHTPLWMWNSQEWEALVQASEKTQKPLLKRALAEVRCNSSSNYAEIELHARLSVFATRLNNMLQSGDSYDAWKVGPIFDAFSTDLTQYMKDYPLVISKLQEIRDSITPLLSSTYKNAGRFNGSYPATLLFPIFDKIQELMSNLAGNDVMTANDEDIPQRFNLSTFIEHIRQLVDIDRNPQYYDSLILRLNSLINNSRLKLVIDDQPPVELSEWLNMILGNSKDEFISIIDLSLLPADMVHLITAILSRLIFEGLQRYRKINNAIFPTVLVVEEAHSFIKKYNLDTIGSNAESLCCQVFEKIAREGRKFGLGLVLSSQRPSELSQTVLSQCNTFLLHRICNDKDQELVHRLLPDNLQGILRDLPILPSRNAILLGWAAELPTLVKMNELPEKQRPQSEDPDFWKVWTRQVERDVNWEKIAADWQGKTENSKTEEPNVNLGNKDTSSNSGEIEPF